MWAGDISFGGDQNTKPNEKSHKGHLSGTVGDEPAVLIGRAAKRQEMDSSPTRGF